MKADNTYIRYSEMEGLCDDINHNFMVLERKIKKTNRRVNNTYLLFGGALIFIYRKLSASIENLNIKCGNF